MKEIIPPASAHSEFEVPDPNVRGFLQIFGIENALRELVVEELSKTSGPRWYKQRLPGDVLKKYEDAVRLQRLTRWTNLVPHHPMYYVDFPDLRKIIERQDNWDASFMKLFGRKELISATLSELEPIRNSLAHNRKISKGDQLLVEVCLGKVVSAIGPERFSRLLSRITVASSIGEELEKLQLELERCSSACNKYQTLQHSGIWESIDGQWWFDETYLGFSTDHIERCFQLFKEYGSLPRHRGQGYALENWVKKSEIDEISKFASAAIRQMIENSK
jgi:hypothetical protein